MRHAIQTSVLALALTSRLLAADQKVNAPVSKAPALAPSSLNHQDGHLYFRCPKLQASVQMSATGPDAPGWPPRTREITFEGASSAVRYANPAVGYDTLECQYSTGYNPQSKSSFQDYYRRDAPLTHPVCKVDQAVRFDCRPLNPGERYPTY